MRVTPIHTRSTTPQKRPAFGITKLAYTQTYGVKEIKNFTMLFRPDLNWLKFAEKLGNHFKNKNRVNIYSAACSDGSEAYSLAIALTQVLGEKESAKFFPIFASDKNKTIIDIAKQRFLNLYPPEVNRTPELEKYLQKSPQHISIPGDALYLEIHTDSYLIKPELAGKVEFKQQDMEECIKNINDKGNTVLMCRNVFPYLYDKSEILYILKLISKKLNPESLFVAGGFDFARVPFFRNYVKDAKFRQFIGLNNVFKRKDI